MWHLMNEGREFLPCPFFGSAEMLSQKHRLLRPISFMAALLIPWSLLASAFLDSNVGRETQAAPSRSTRSTSLIFGEDDWVGKTGSDCEK